MKINGSNEIKNDTKLNNQKTNEIRHDNKFIRDVDFNNVPNPAEMLGRSMVNFAANVENKVSAQNEQDVIVTDRDLKNKFNEMCKKLNLGVEISVGELKVVLNSVDCSKEDLEAKFELLELITKRRPDFEKNSAILSVVTKENLENFKNLVSDENIDLDRLSVIAGQLTKDNLPQIKELLQDYGLNLERVQEANGINEDNIGIIKQISNREDIGRQDYIYITGMTTKTNKELAAKLMDNKNIDNEYAYGVLYQTMFENIENLELKKQFIENLLDDSDFKLSKMGYYGGKLLDSVNPVNYDIAEKIYKDHEDGFYFINDFLKSIDEENKDVAMKIAENMPKNYDKKIEISANTEKYLDLIEKFKGTDDYETLFEGHLFKNVDMNEAEAVLNSENYSAATKLKIISVMDHRISKEDAEKFVDELDKNDRFKDNSQSVANLCVLASMNDISADFFSKIISNKGLSDNDVYHLTEASLAVTDSDELEDDEKTDFINAIPLDNSLSPKTIIDAMKNLNYNNLEITKYILEENSKNNSQIGFSENLLDKDISTFERLEKISELPKSTYTQLYTALRDSSFGNTPKEIEKKYQVIEYVMKNLDNTDIDEQSFCDDLRTVLALIRKEPEFVDFMMDNKAPSSLMFEATKKIIDGVNVEFLQNVLSDKNLNDEDKMLLLSNSKSSYLTEQYKEEPTLSLKLLKTGVSAYYLPKTIEIYKDNPEIVQKMIDSDIKDSSIEKFSQFDDKIKENILEGIEKAKNDYNLDLKGGNVIDEKYNGDDAFILIQFPSQNSETYLKFDKDTGELVAVSSRDYCINVKNKTKVTTSTKTEGFEIGDQSDPLSGGIVDTPFYMGNIISNTDGTPLRSLIYSEGDTNSEFDIYDVTPQGKKYKIGFVEFDNLGGKHIERTLTSLDGTKIDHVYADDVNGNRFLYQKITDKNGKLLFESKKRFNVLSENHFVTSTDNNSFDVQIDDDKVVISKLDKNKKKTGETVQYKIADFTDEEYEKLYTSLSTKDINNPDDVKKWVSEQKLDFVIDRKLLPALKQFSGEEWLNMYNSDTKLVLGGYPKKDNAGSCGGAILVSETHYSSADTIAHELGHEKFDHLKLQDDKELRKIYEEEKKLFTSTFPDMNINSIAYFLAGNNSDSPRGINETVAEINQILNVPQSWDITRDRTILLQHYFPRTFAYISNKIQSVQN